MPMMSDESANGPGSGLRVRNLSPVVPSRLAWHHFCFCMVPCLPPSVRYVVVAGARAPRRHDRGSKVFTKKRDSVRRFAREVFSEEGRAI